MPGKRLTTRIVLRNDTLAAWAAANPVLRKGEIGVVFDPQAPSVATDTYVVDFKIGDGITAWNDLSLFRGPITTRLTTAEGNIATLQGQMAIVQGTAGVAGSIAHALQDAKDYADALVAGIDLSQIELNKQAIEVLNGSVGVAGSVAHSVAAETTRATNAEDLLAARISALEGSHFEVVQTLPATGETNVIYLVPRTAPETGYSEWIYINNAWEEIGDTNIDLSNYYNKSEVDSMVGALNTRVTTIENDYLKSTDELILDCGTATTNITSS